MIRWLRDNPIGQGLAVLCGLLLTVMLLLGVVSLLPVDRDAEAGADAAGEDVLALPQLAETPPIDEYYVITQRPLFNPSRQPQLDTSPAEELAPPELADTDAPDVELSGVVITPSLRMAMLRHKDGDRSLVAFEGRPIEGDFGSWQVSRVDAREVVLTSGSGEELALQLKVHDERIEPPPAVAPRQPEPSQEPEQAAEEQEPAEGEQLSRAEEIRRRIAERREELRQQAEMQEQAEQENANPSYQEAIRSMIGRSRRDNRDSQDEQ